VGKAAAITVTKASKTLRELRVAEVSSMDMTIKMAKLKVIGQN